MTIRLAILAAGDAGMAAALGLIRLIMFGIFLCIRSLFVLAAVMLARSCVLSEKSRFSNSNELQGATRFPMGHRLLIF